MKSGFAVLVGRSNVGKSTLLNALVGTKVAITTPKPQTTRHAIQGVIHDPRGQAVIVDTPGVFSRIPDELTSKLNDKAKQSLKDIDLVLYVVDPTRHVGDEEQIVRRMVMAADCPKVMVMNKSDLKGRFKHEFEAWEADFDAVIEVSASKGHNLNALKDAVFEYLPEGEPLYPDDMLTNLDREFRISELIREKAFLALEEEVPYSVTAEVDEISERDNGMLYIAARLITNAPRYKRMIVGGGGKTIKRIGQSVRKELELVTDRKVFLDLQVEVDDRWQERFQ
ncbi:GTPase Era [Patescibacteria group bacterium]